MWAKPPVYQITIMLIFSLVAGIHCSAQDAVVATIDRKGDRLDFFELTDLLGLPAEKYSVVTEDGYILRVFRIPGRKQPPILFVPGIELAADSWLLRGNTSLPYVLSKRGHDLWLVNVRGTIYSRRHISLDPDVDPAFWDYSFHEHGYYDLPAVINTILVETGSPTISAIAYSQGNTMFYVLMATRPEYNEIVNVAIALAPIAYLNNLGPPLSLFIRHINEVDDLLKTLGVNEFLGYNNTATKIIRNMCLVPRVGYLTCAYGFIFSFTGYDPTEIEPAFFRITNYYFLVGSSRKNVIHFGQVGKSGVFGRFDYGAKKNLAVYNSTTPPAYNLSNVRVPLVMLVGKNDRPATPANARRLRDRLRNVKQFTILPRLLASHVDFIWGRTMQKNLHPYVLSAL